MPRPALISWLFALSVIPVSLGCGEVSKGEESALPGQGKEDSFREPTEHGKISFVGGSRAEITPGNSFHAWEFDLVGAAKVRIATMALEGQRNLDTVMYLYQQGEDGSYGRYLARNDDAGGSKYSIIEQELQAGTYRILVKGYDATELGIFGLGAHCEGAGCAPDPDITDCNEVTDWLESHCFDEDESAANCLRNAGLGSFLTDCCDDPERPYSWCPWG